MVQIDDRFCRNKAQIDSALRPPPGRPAWSAQRVAGDEVEGSEGNQKSIRESAGLASGFALLLRLLLRAKRSQIVVIACADCAT